MLKLYKLNGFGQPNGKVLEVTGTSLGGYLASTGSTVGFRVSQVSDTMGYIITPDGANYLVKEVA